MRQRGVGGLEGGMACGGGVTDLKMLMLGVLRAERSTAATQSENTLDLSVEGA